MPKIKVWEVTDRLNETDRAGLVHCWETTKLLQAWEKPVQTEALLKAADIFPNFTPTDADTIEDPLPDEDDEEAYFAGEAFVEGGGDDDTEEWLQMQPPPPPRRSGRDHSATMSNMAISKEKEQARMPGATPISR